MLRVGDGGYGANGGERLSQDLEKTLLLDDEEDVDAPKKRVYTLPSDDEID